MEQKKNKINTYYKNRQWTSVFLVKKLINLYIQNGKKNQANKIVLEALEKINKKTKKDSFLILSKAVFNLKNSFELKKIKKGAVMFEIPFPVKDKRKQILKALRLLAKVSRTKEKNLSDSLADNIIQASLKKGICFENKIDFLKKVHSNRVYLHWRW